MSDQQAMDNIMRRKWLHRRQRGGSERYPKWTIFYEEADGYRVTVAEVVGPETLVNMFMELRRPWMGLPPRTEEEWKAALLGCLACGECGTALLCTDEGVTCPKCNPAEQPKEKS